MKLVGPPHTWPLEARIEWDERAAIMEFDGSLPTSQAEAEAERIIRAEWRARDANQARKRVTIYLTNRAG